MVGAMNIVVPIQSMEQIIEVKVTAPPPMAEPWVSGLAQYGDRVLVGVRLTSEHSGTLLEQGWTKGVLMRAGARRLSWLLEIDAVRKLIQTSVHTHQATQTANLLCPEPWLVPATTAEGRHLSWLDAPAVADQLWYPTYESR